jgi:hypothetical protein
MYWRNPSRASRRLLGLVGALAVGAVLAGIVWAQIPQDGVYTGCYRKPGGTIRIVDASQDCKRGETRITWNQAGEPGPQGEPGAPAPGAVMTRLELCDEGGCSAPLTITEQDVPVTILTMERPNGGEAPWDRTIALASIEIENVGTEGAHMGCLLGQDDWNFWLPTGEEGGSTVTFVSPYEGSGEVVLTCNPGNGPPGYVHDIRVTGATLTLVPADSIDAVHPG